MASPSASLPSTGCPPPVGMGSSSLGSLKAVSRVPPPTCASLVRRDKRLATSAPAQPHSSVRGFGPGTVTWAVDPSKRVTAAAAAAAAEGGGARRGGEGVRRRSRRPASGVECTERRTRGVAARAVAREDGGTTAQADCSEGKRAGEAHGESDAGAATSRDRSGGQEAAREDGMNDRRGDEREGAREISRDEAMEGMSPEPPPSTPPSSSTSFLREPLPYSERVSSGPHSLLDDAVIAPSTSAIFGSSSNSSSSTINTSDCSSGSGDAGDAELGFGTAAATNARFELEFSAETSAIALVYFVQGVLGLSRLAVTFFLKDECGLDPAEVAVLTGVSTLPWLIKPLYGFISDAIPLFGYRRRSYLVLCGLTGALSWLLMATAVHDELSAVAMILLSSLSAAVSDVVVDSIVVTRARGEEQGVAGSLQSLCWGSSAFGSILSAYFSGSLVEQWGPRYVFGLTAVLPLITTAVGFFVPEERLEQQQQQQQQKQQQQNTSPTSQPVSLSSASMRMQHAPQTEKYSDGPNEITGHLHGTSSPSLSRSLQKQFGQLWETFQLPAILLPTVFIFFWQATPHSETAMFFYTTNVLGFGPEFLGRVRLVTAIASLAGVLLFNSYLKAVPLRRLFLWTNVVGVLLGSSQLLLVTGLNRALGISDQFFLLGDSVVLTVLGQISFMPVLVLAAQICPAGIEATLFATLMSVSNGAGVFGGFIGAGLTSYLHVTSDDFTNLPLLLIICNCSSLLALPLLRLLPEGGEDGEGEKRKEA